MKGRSGARRPTTNKFPWSGVLTSAQPRIRLDQSLEERSHAHQGHVLQVRGTTSSAKEWLEERGGEEGG